MGVVEDTKLEGSIVKNGNQMIAYADDIVMLARDKGKLVETERLKKKAEYRELKINHNKAKYMIHSRR